MRTLAEYARLAEERLPKLIEELPEGEYEEGGMPWLLAASMRYSLLAGGKRLRPSMVMAAVEMLGGKAEDVLDFACAVEMIHTYSLIHDDLPGMDNDTMRRGRPTNHVVFGEGQAILAGDGLLNFAFETMLAHALKTPEKSRQYLEAISEVACGSGVTGMIAGQVMDLYCENQPTASGKALRYIQRDKTACMFIYPMRAAGRIMSADEETLDRLTRYADAFGRLFQVTDDILDVVGSAEQVGKTLGKDAESGKLTAVSAYGLDGARQLARQLRDEAADAIGAFGKDAAFFVSLVDSMVSRTF